MDTAIITGASRGIGKEIACHLAELGYFVLLISRYEEQLINVVNDIKLAGCMCDYIVADISDLNDMQKIKNEVSQLSSVSVLVNNAGHGVFGRIEEVSDEDLISQIDVNLKAPILLCKNILPLMKKNERSVIVFINSIAGRKAYLNSAAYVASKFGLRGFADSLREELRSDNIKVVSVHPGAVNTSFWENIDSGFDQSQMLDPKVLVKFIVDSINAPGNMVIEEIVIRRVGGDF